MLRLIRTVLPNTMAKIWGLLMAILKKEKRGKRKKELRRRLLFPIRKSERKKQALSKYDALGMCIMVFKIRVILHFYCIYH